jgi:hypothetical protein
VPEALEIIDGVFGLTELVPPRARKGRSDLKTRSSEATDPLGFIYPGWLRSMYQVPSEFVINPKSSLGVVEFLDYSSYDPSDNGLFNQGMNEKVHVDKIVGPFSGVYPTLEPTLDVQVRLTLFRLK